MTLSGSAGRTASQRSSGERGAVVFITLLLTPILIGIIYLTINLATLKLVEIDIQNISDSAAAAALSTLLMNADYDEARPLTCPSLYACWFRAYHAALKVIEAHSIQAGVLTRVNLQANVAGDFNHEELLAAETEEERIAYYQKYFEDIVALGENVTVKLQGGIFSEGHFRDAEIAWFATDPQLFNVSLLNGFQISFEVERIPFLVGASGSLRRTSIERTSFAQFGQSDTVQVAPFAIPLCALTSTHVVLALESFPYNPTERLPLICAADRFFTASTRYGPTHTRPEFSWSPTMDPGIVSKKYVCGSSWDNPEYMRLANVESGVYYQFQGPNTKSQEYQGRPSDHFGVVGVPANSINPDNPLSESMIREIISRPAPTVPARLGDKFEILRSGLTEVESGDAVWAQITDSIGELDSPPDIHPAYREIEWGGIAATVPPPGRQGKCSPEPHIDILNRRLKNFQHNGICNSRRFGYHPSITGCHGLSIQNGNAPATASPKRYGFFDGVSFDTPVWKTIIPVVAQTGSEAKQCYTTNTDRTFSPPPVDGEYVIVGFVQAYIYDVDIGAPPPPEVSCPKKSGPAPWSFTLDDGGSPNCNLVRARIDCHTYFIAASDNPSSLAVPTSVVQ